MNNSSTVVGLDVHKDSIVAAVLPARADKVSEVISIGNSSFEIKRLVERITRRGAAEFVYEAGILHDLAYKFALLRERAVRGAVLACSALACGTWFSPRRRLC